MRYQLLALGSVLLAACGDDGDVKYPDAKIWMDAPVDTAPTCSIAALPALSLGSMATPVDACKDQNNADAPCNWFGALTMGGMEKYFSIAGGIPMNITMDTDNLPDVLVIRVFEATTGQTFKTGTPYTFETNPTATTIAGSAIAFLAEDVGSTGQAMRYYWASSGTVTLQNIDKTTGTIINGSVALTNLREVNLQTGADVPGGCTTSLMGLSFFLKQETNAARVVSTPTSLTSPDVNFGSEVLPTN